MAAIRKKRIVQELDDGTPLSEDGKPCFANDRREWIQNERMSTPGLPRHSLARLCLQEQRAARIVTALASAALGSCSGAPSRNILGSYFPSWMICALLGLLLAALAHRLLSLAKLDEALPAPLLVYLAASVAFSFAIWLVWLG